MKPEPLQYRNAMLLSKIDLLKDENEKLRGELEKFQPIGWMITTYQDIEPKEEITLVYGTLTDDHYMDESSEAMPIYVKEDE